jgi:MoaA/NifB/PqqE/SkfB family radical SAM enzyme
MMDTEAWLAAIRGLAALGTMRLKFQGGEPTLRPDFRTLSAAARKAGLITAVITNGRNIVRHPDLLDAIDEVVVSLDSPTPEVHDRLRGAGSHEDAVAALELARERHAHVFVVMVASQANLFLVESMLAFCEARGIRLHVQPVLFGRDAFDDGARAIGLSPGQMRDLHQTLARWKKDGRKLLFSSRAYAQVARWEDFAVLTTNCDGRSKCMAGKFYVHIETNGDIWPCAQHGAHFRPKNILTDGLEEALRNARGHDCADCFSVYLNERKAVFGLNPRAIVEVVRRG